MGVDQVGLVMTKLFASICFLSLLAWRAPGAQVVFNLSDFTSSPQAVRSLVIFPIGTPKTNGAGGIITRDMVRRVTGPTGSVTISNVFDGDYRSELAGAYTTTTNWFHFPATTATINASDYATSLATNGTGGIMAYSQSQADARFALIGATAGLAAVATRLATNDTQVFISPAGSSSNYYATFGNTASNSFWLNKNGSFQGLSWALNQDGSVQFGNGLGLLGADGSIGAAQLTGTVAAGRLPALASAYPNAITNNENRAAVTICGITLGGFELSCDEIHIHDIANGDDQYVIRFDTQTIIDELPPAFSGTVVATWSNAIWSVLTTNRAAWFEGNGGGITNVAAAKTLTDAAGLTNGTIPAGRLPAGNISSGTLADARLGVQAMLFSTNATALTVTVNTNAASGLNSGGTAVLNPGWSDVTITNNAGQVLWREIRGSITFTTGAGTQPTGGTWFTNTVSPAFSTQPEILVSMNGQGWITSGSIGALIANTNGVNSLAAFTVGKTSQVLAISTAHTVAFSIRSRN